MHVSLPMITQTDLSDSRSTRSESSSFSRVLSPTPYHLEVLTALAIEQRLEVLVVLSQGPRDVSTLCAELQLAGNALSYHLRTLRNCCLVRAERIGTRRIYQLTNNVRIRRTDRHTHIDVEFDDGGSIELALPNPRL